MDKTPLYITMGLLLVSAIFVTGAIADDVALMIEPFVSERSFVGVSYAEDVEAISIPDMGYDKLQVKPSYSYLQLQPGETSSVSITVINRDDEAVIIATIMVLQPYTENYLEEWVTITPSNVMMKPDEKREFTVEVAVSDASIRIEVSTNQYEYSSYAGGSSTQSPSFELVLKMVMTKLNLSL